MERANTNIEAACERLSGAIEDLVVTHDVGTAEGCTRRRLALDNAILAFAVELLRAGAQ